MRGGSSGAPGCLLSLLVRCSLALPDSRSHKKRWERRVLWINSHHSYVSAIITRHALVRATAYAGPSSSCRRPPASTCAIVPSCAAPRLPVAEPVYSADAVYDQVRESTVLAVENAKHAVGMA